MEKPFTLPPHVQQELLERLGLAQPASPKSTDAPSNRELAIQEENNCPEAAAWVLNTLSCNDLYEAALSKAKNFVECQCLLHRAQRKRNLKMLSQRADLCGESYQELIEIEQETGCPLQHVLDIL